MYHTLKTLPQFFADIVSGAKTFELRKDDRGYKTGDTLILQEFVETTEDGKAKSHLTGREHMIKVTSILTAEDVKGLYQGFVILSFGTTESAAVSMPPAASVSELAKADENAIDADLAGGGDADEPLSF